MDEYTVHSSIKQLKANESECIQKIARS